MSRATIRTDGPRQDALSPSARIVHDAGGHVEIVRDSLNRPIGVHKLTALDRMRVLRMLGTDSNNMAFAAYAMIAACVASIDGEQIPPPNSYRELEMIVKRLDNEGCDAVGLCLQEKFGVKADTPQTEHDEQIKN